jgi:hypothetical protein
MGMALLKVSFVMQVSGSDFRDIDLSDGDFAEYDEKASCPVGISNLNHKFTVTR